MVERRGVGGHRPAMVRILSALVPAVDDRMIPDATIVIVTKDRRDEALLPELPASVLIRDNVRA
jgi:hypothetical protein